jgi:tetratricopeptide (TPR) repeat protein
LLLAFATLLIFLPVGWHQFVNYDDTDYVTENPFVKNGLNWTDIQWAFTAFHAGNWHPLTWISHQLDCELFGLNAGAQHIVNVLFHSANVVLLFILIWRWTSLAWPAAFIAALFAWHPLHVESVAWIAERKDVLSTLFALLALLSYTKFAKENCRRSFWFALIFFALGLLAKPMLVTLPFCFLLMDFWPLQRLKVKSSGFKASSLLLEKIPFFLLVAASCVVTFFAQRSGEAVASLARVPLHYRLENAPIAVASYLLKIFWPANLCAIYPLERIFAWQVVLSAAVLIFISAVAWRWRNSRPYFLFGWLWFLGTLMPVIGLVQVGGQSMADRYTYIPSIGFFIAIVLLARELALRLQTPKIITAGIAALILLACIRVTEFQLQFWRDSESLFRRAVAVTHDNGIALVNLGAALDVQHRFDEAIVIYRAAEKLQTQPSYQLHNNLGNILGLLGRHEESLAEYGYALHLRPNDPYMHNAAGSELAALGRFDDAFKEFFIAEKLNPTYAAPHLETAKIFLRQGRDADAVSELRLAVNLAPDDFQILAYTAHILAANQNAAARDGHAALLLAAKANDLSGHIQPMVFDAMGMACAELGDFTNAQACAQTAIDLGTALQIQNLGPISNRLELYKKNLPWRESFRATNAPEKN